MPTYEYACRDCGEHLEVVQSFKDDALTECPNCQGSLRKVFSAAGIIFKGSGWHSKDYGPSKRSGGSGGGEDTSSAESSSSDTASESTSDKKSDTTSDKKSDSKSDGTSGGSSSSGSSEAKSA